MAQTKTQPATPKAIKDAENTWDKFVKISQICGAATILTLIIMALTLV